jgi:hypothetical protein
MYMRIERSIRDDLFFSCDHVGIRSYYHVRMHAFHDIWISRLSDSNNGAILHADVGLDNQ